MASYRSRALARKDLELIWDYTLERWGIDQAERYLASLFSCFDDLSKNPKIGKPRDDVMPEARSFPQGRHVIFTKLITSASKFSELFIRARTLNGTLIHENEILYSQ
jgi:toxin ParE1/3/4